MGQTLQWLDVCGKPDVNRVELLDRLNAALADSSFLAGPLVTVADYLMYFMVHPVVVCSVVSPGCCCSHTVHDRHFPRAVAQRPS
jgi:glutathione S-transferase